jgi:hypothetical protein
VILASAGLGGKIETVFEGNPEERRFGIGNSVHGTVQMVLFKRKFHVVEVGKQDALVHILLGSFHKIRCRPSSARHQIHDLAHDITLVVMDVPRRNEEPDMGRPRCLGKIVAQRNFIGAWIVIDQNVGLGVGNRRMVHGHNDEVD